MAKKTEEAKTETVTVPKGVKMLAPANVGAIGRAEEEQYTVVDGCIYADPSHVVWLQAHGFILAPIPAAKGENDGA